MEPSWHGAAKSVAMRNNANERPRVTFDYKGIQTRLVETVTVHDVVWTCRLLSRLSAQQWDDAFRAAAYQPAERQRFIAKLKSKIDQGLALASS